MTNIRKSFNFRNGVQVDNDNFVVNSLGNVGIGTTIPTEALDIIGNVKVNGILTATTSRANLFESTSLSVSTVSLTDSIIGSGVSIRSGVITDTGSGIVTYYGDGRFLQGLPTSQWIDVDVGLGFTSIYNQGYVGVSTDDPRYNFQIGGTNDLGNFSNGVGIDSTGNIVATGIVTANKFVGVGSDLTQLNANSIDYGTISSDRLPTITNDVLAESLSFSGIITATEFSGNLTGTATTATNLEDASNIIAGTISNDRIPDIVESNINVTSGLSTFNNINANTINAALNGTASFASDLTGSPNITVGVVTASSIVGDVNDSNIIIGIVTALNVTVTGIITATTKLNIGDDGSGITGLSDGRLGIGTEIPTSELQIRKPSDSLLEVVSDSGQARISVGQSVGVGNSSGILVFGSNDKTLDLINKDTGNLNFVLHGGSAGLDTGRFDWLYGQDIVSPLASLTYEGNFGIGETNPTNTLHVVGTSTVTSTAYFGGDIRANKIYFTELEDGVVKTNANITSGISTFNRVYMTGGDNVLSINTDNPIGSNKFYIADSTDAYLGNQASMGSAVAADATYFANNLGADAAQLKVYGSSYVGSDLYVRGNINNISISSGIVTAPNGFTSGTGGAVQISVVGSTLTFTVGGLSASLTLS